MRAVLAVGLVAVTTGAAHAGGLPLRPVPGEPFFGEVVARGPVAARTATVSSRGVNRRVDARRGVVRARVSGPVGPRGVSVVMRRADGSTAAVRRSAGAFLLPASAAVAVPGRRRVRSLDRRLARIAARHGGTTAIWIQYVRTGRVASWNADAEFPAASLVKLPLTAGAIMRMGSRPWLHASWPEVVAVLRRSDDHAANRLVDAVGSGCGSGPDAAAADGLRRLGAHQSTYPGCYLTENELQPRLPSGGVSATPVWSTRHTTARDMGRMLFSLHAAAVPTRAGTRQTGIDPLRARMLLGLMLTSEQVGANASLFAGKNGWREGEQHGSGIAYTRSGPVIMVVLTQRDGRASLSDARAIGAEVARAAVRG